ncbi:tyrosine-protein phosphatase [Motilimonas pumila]|uniref:protein-tyrosine-phosphatase n=1 Tax=Motilimonas pumila TaxID=2303987 RepID=A0A418YF69_9GAMM|nr:CpsB/CapC family capsule biosynthesis tyrosine phosphatase [Motilimonas pumila]RJG47905.1 capsular biosynthesis protein [Motilimonas pumila]
MIDLHCHILPGIDDGPPSYLTSVLMLQAAKDDGISHCVFTPHIEAGRFDNDKAIITQSFNSLLEHASDYSCSFAAEVRLDPQIMQWVKQEKLPFLGRYRNKDVLLLEFPHSHIPPGSDNLTAWLLAQGVLPMIAHPERNRAVWEQPSKLQPFIKQGCLMQITAGALLGQFGEISLQRAEELLQQGLVDVMASDAHNLTNRPPKLAAAKNRACELIGEVKAKALVVDTPAAILGF